MSDERRARGMYVTPFKVLPPRKASQTLLNKISVCPYSGALYLKEKGGPQSHAMARGEAIHAAIEACTNLMIESGEQTIPQEVAKDYMQAVLDERVDLAMSPAEHDACRAALWNWASDTLIDPSSLVAVETMLELEIGGRKIRGKLDRAEIADGEGYVYDYKTGLGFPSQETHDQDFQQLFYGLLLLEGVGEDESIPLGKGLRGVHLTAVYPRITGEDGRCFRRSTYKDRGQIHDFRRTVESALLKLDHGLETGEWKASPGAHCDYCPARKLCPIPEADLPTAVVTEGQAAEVGERVIVLENELKDLRGSVKSWVEENEPLRVGDQEFCLVPQETEVTRSKDDLKAALRDAGLDPDDFYRTQRGMRFKRVKIKEEAA